MFTLKGFFTRPTTVQPKICRADAALLSVCSTPHTGVKNVAQKTRCLNRNTRAVFDYLNMTRDSASTRLASVLK